MVCNIVMTELKNPTWKTGSCKSMKPKCPGQSFSPLLQVMHVASFWLTPYGQPGTGPKERTRIIIGSKRKRNRITHQLMIEHAVRMRRTGRVVVVYGVQVSGVDAQVWLALDVLGVVDGEADLGSAREETKKKKKLTRRRRKKHNGSRRRRVWLGSTDVGWKSNPHDAGPVRVPVLFFDHGGGCTATAGRSRSVPQTDQRMTEQGRRTA